MSDYRAIVLGLGGIGSAAAYWLSRRSGEEVLGIEQFELGHGRGGSEDHSRIIRLSYHTPGYVEMAKAAYDAWETLEVESGEQVVLQNRWSRSGSPSSVDRPRRLPNLDDDGRRSLRGARRRRGDEDGGRNGVCPTTSRLSIKSSQASPWHRGPTALIAARPSKMGRP